MGHEDFDGVERYLREQGSRGSWRGSIVFMVTEYLLGSVDVDLKFDEEGVCTVM